MKTLGILSIIVVALILLSRTFVHAYDEISPKDLQEKLAGEGSGIVLLDVREHDEVAECRIPKSVHIPLADVNRRLKELDPQKEIVVYCAAGVRSARAAGVLDKAGFKKVKNLKGGIRSWAGSGGKVEGPCK